MDLVEVENKLFRDDVLNMRSEGDIVVACERGKRRVGAGALGNELLRAGFGGGRVLGNAGLDAFDSEPVGCLYQIC